MKKEPKSKIALLADAREKKVQKEAEAAGVILLDKRDRRQVAGLIAQEQIIQEKVVGPHQENLREFLAESQEKYGVTIGVTHNMDWQNCQLVPIPPKEEPKAEA